MSIRKQYLDVGNDYFMQMIIQKVICKKVLRLQQMGCLTKGLQNETFKQK